MDLTLIRVHVLVWSNHGIPRYEDTFAVRQERKQLVGHARQDQTYIQGKTKIPPVFVNIYWTSLTFDWVF